MERPRTETETETETKPGPDLLFQADIRAAVRQAYQAVPIGAGRAVTDRFYDDSEMAAVPASARDWALGVGNPVRHARLRPGEVVLDIGCGAGIDTVLAARAVGPNGRVIGLDTLTEMCDRAGEAVRIAGADSWCKVRTGEMEAIPLADDDVDVVISNGVLNLSPRKSRAIAEMARVLRPGGRICIADLVVDRELPPAVLASEAAWAGCIAGAVSEQVLIRKLERRGFVDVSLGQRRPFSVDDLSTYPLFPDDVTELMRRLLPAERQGAVATGVLVTAVNAGAPAQPPPIDGAATGVVPLSHVTPADAEAPGVTVRQLKQVDDVHLKVLDVAPRRSTRFHTHVHAHEGVVIAGRGALRLADRREALGAGDVFTVNPNAAHAIENHGDEPLRFVCMDCFVE